jgi:translocation and assembly module TamB
MALKFPVSKKSRVLVIGALVLTIGAVALSLYINSTAFRQLVLGRVNTSLDGRIVVAGHRLSLLAGRLVLTGVRLERSDGRPLAEIGRLSLQVAWSSLLQRTVRVSTLALDDVRLFLEFDDQGRLLRIGPASVSRGPETSRQASAPWRVVVDRFRLHGGAVVYRQPSRKWSAELENIQSTAGLDTGLNQGRLRFSAGPLVWYAGDDSRTLPELTITADYNGAAPSTIDIQAGRSRLSVRGRLIPDHAAPALDLTADMDMALDELAPWIPGNVRLEGLATASLTARGPVNDPVVDLHLTLPRGKLAGIPVSPLKADVNYTRERISVEALQAGGRWGELEAAGTIDPAGGAIDRVTATMTSPDLAALGAVLGVELPSGSGRLQLDCTGSLTHPGVRAQLLARDLKWRQFDFGRLVAAADLDAAGTLTFSHLALENQGSLVEGRGGLTLQAADGQWRPDPGIDLILETRHLEPADFGLDLPVQALLGVGFVVKGTVRHLKGKATLTPSRLQWKDRTFELAGSALWEDGRLTIPELTLSKNTAELRLQGRMVWRDPRSGGWLDPPRIQAGMRSRNVRLQDFFAGYSGAVTLEGEVAGTPAGLNGDLKVTGSDLKLAGQPMSAAVIKGRLEGRKFYLETVDLAVAAGQEIRAKGWYGFDRQFQLTVNSAGIGLDHIPALQRAYPVEGLLSLSLNGRGTFAHPLLTAELTVHNPRLNHQPWNDFHLNARLENRQLSLDADLNFALKARTHLDSGNFDLTARLADADLSPYLAMGGGAQWGGKLSARLQAGGNWHRPDEIRADLDVEKALLRYQSLDLLRTRNLQVRLRDGRLEIPPSRLEFMESGFVNLSASGDVPKDLRLSAGGKVPLSALAPFSDDLGDAQGELTFEADASGALDALQWRADVNLADIALEIPGLNQEVRKLNGRVRLTPDELKLEQVSGLVDNGRFDLSGRVTLADWTPTGGKLELKAQSLPLQWPDTMDVVLNGDLILAGARGANALTGRVVLLEGTYYKDVRLNLLSAVSQPRRAEPVPVTYELPRWLADIGLNVSLAHRYPLLVDNNLARLQVAPDLKLTGTLGRPVLSGRARVTEGEVIFRRKTFTVKRGVVDFINPYKIEPTLDIEAQAQIRQWLVTLNLSGTPDRLVFQLSSDPPESESDILSLILLGRTSSELSGGQGGGGQSTRQMLAALVATAWGEDVKKTTGVDILEVETGTGDTDDSADTIQVTVGKRLSRRLTIKYEVESGSEELIQRAVSEYRFIEHLLASGFQDSLGGYGGELLFRIEF